MSAEWFCDFAGSELGPLSFQQLKVMAEQGRLRPQDKLKRGRDGKWVAAARVDGLFSTGSGGAGEPAAEELLEATSGSTRPQQTERPRPAKATAKKKPPSKAVRPLDLPVAQPAPRPPEPPPAATPTVDLPQPEIPVARPAQPAAAARAPVAATVPSAMPATRKPSPRGESKMAPAAGTSGAAPTSAGFGIVAEDPVARLTGRTPAAATAAQPAPVSKRKDRSATIALVSVLAFLILMAAGLALWYWQPGGGSGDRPTTMSSVVGEDKLASAEEGILPADPLAQPATPSGADPASGSTAPGSAAGATTPAVGPTAPPSGSGEGSKEWLDASKQSARRGEIGVRIVSATVERPRGARGVAPEPCLVLALELSNTNSEKIREYTSWNSRAPVAAGTQLLDNLGNEYKMKYFAAPLDGQVSKGSIYPNEKLRDVLVFQRPIQSAKLQYLRLRLPAATFGERGVMQFEIPAAWVQQGEENPFTDSPDGPRRPQPRPSTDAPAQPQQPPATDESTAPPKPDDPNRERSIFEDMPDLFPQLKKEGGGDQSEPPAGGGIAPAEGRGEGDRRDEKLSEPGRPAARDNPPLERAPIDGVGEPPTGDAL